MLFDNFNDLLKILVGVLMIKQPICQFLECFEKAIQVHLIVVTSSNNIFVYYVVMCLQDVTVGEPLVLTQLLKLGACDEIVTFLSSQNFEHFFGVTVKVQLIELTVLKRQDFLEESLLCELLGLLMWQSDNLNTIRNQIGLNILIQFGKRLLNVSIWEFFISINIE